MKEDQNTEFKEAWHDEYTRYISAFCNTHGGRLHAMYCKPELK